MKITQIELNNYRGFYGKHVIDTNGGKNLLIYGENGSGKSSLFIAFKQYLKASLLTPVGNIGQYLEEIHIDAIPQQASVSITFDNGNTHHYKSTGSNHNQPFIQDASKVRSLLSYKNIVRMYLGHEDILHNNDVLTSRTDFGYHFFRLLIGDILTDFELPRFGRTLGEFWNDYKLVDTHDASTTIGKNAIAKIDSEISKFNVLFAAWLVKVKSNSNKILKDYFNHLNIEIEQFDFVNIPLVSGQKKGERFKSPQLNPVIKFNGRTEFSFRHRLNEARLSALALSIYLSAITTQPPTDFQVLFLDDIFIGLDTSNRIPLLKCLNEFSFTDQKYNNATGSLESYERRPFEAIQLIITTYDRHWYNIALRRLKNTNPDSWLFLELYTSEQDVKGKQLEVPIILPHEDNLARGYRYFKQTYAPDYPASANYLRKALEEIISSKLPIKEFKKESGEPEWWGLKDYIQQSIYFLGRIDKDTTTLRQLKNNLQTLLNPLSHYNIDSPIYKEELREIIGKTNSLSAQLDFLKSGYKQVLSQGNWIRLSINLPTGNKGFYSLKLKEDLYLYKQPPTNNLKLSKCVFFDFVEWEELDATGDSIRNGRLGNGIAVNYKSIEDAFNQLYPVVIGNHPTVTKPTNYLLEFEYSSDNKTTWNALNGLVVPF